MEHIRKLQSELTPYLQHIYLSSDRICWEKLDHVCDLWLKFSRSMNLSGARTLKELIPHITEGLQVLALIEKLNLLQNYRKWLDVGSGAGFPALILLSSLELEMTLIEPRESRATFLQIALAALNKSHCQVIRGRLGINSWRPVNLSVLKPDFATFSITSARALFPVEQWLKVASSWLQPGSICICHMKPEDKDPQDSKLIDQLSSARWSIRAYRI